MLLRSYYLRTCFNAMKRQYTLNIGGIHRLQQLLKITNDEQKRFAWEQIRLVAAINHENNGYERFSSRNILHNIMERRQRLQIARYFNKFRANCDNVMDRERTLKSIIGKRFCILYKSVF